MINQTLINKLLYRAQIRRQSITRKSVQQNAPDSISDLLEEAAEEIYLLNEKLNGNSDSRCEKPGVDHILIS